MRKLLITLASIFTFFFLVVVGIQIWNAVTFEYNCEAYLKRAADASTVEMAKTELAKSIKYSEDNNLTSGIVSIFLKNPKNDVGFWYNNMKQAYIELDTLPANSSSLEKTNVLMKLRESLTDQGKDSASVTVPDGISIYPHNVVFFWLTLILLVLCVAFWLWQYLWDNY